MKSTYDIINRYGRFQINMKTFIYPIINSIIRLMLLIPEYILIPNTVYRYVQVVQGIMEFRNVLLLLIFEDDDNAHYYIKEYRHPYCFASITEDKPNTLQYDDGIIKEFKNTKEYIAEEKKYKFITK